MGQKRMPDPALPAAVQAVPDPARQCVRIRLDGALLGRVDAEAWRALALDGVGRVDAETWPMLRAALQRRAAVDHGLRLLATRDRSRRELERRLAVAHGAAATAAALDRLAPYIDDERFARAWVEARQRRGPLGPAALLAGLSRQGVARDLARRAVAERLTAGPAASAAPDAESQAEACMRAAEARLRRTGDARAPRDRARLQAFLARRGFDQAVITSVLRSLLGEGGLADARSHGGASARPHAGGVDRDSGISLHSP